MRDYYIGVFVGEQPQPVAKLPTNIITALLDHQAVLEPALPHGVTLDDIVERLRIELTARKLGLSGE